MSIPSTVKVHPYEGGNDVIDRLKDDDEEVWICNGQSGRRVFVMAVGSTAEEVWALYRSRWMDGAEDDE